LLALAASVPVACGDEFEGCKATRTCPRTNDAGEGGESGETGGNSGGSAQAGSGPAGGTAGSGGAARGGASGSSGAPSQNGGTAGGGGEGGASADTDPPTIVSITPDDGASDVERDVTVRIEFSERLDESTVTSSSVRLDGPDGTVSGTLSVDEDLVTFVADQPLDLLGTYSLTVDGSLTDRAGNAVARSLTSHFAVRDGRWGQRSFPFGTEVARNVNDLDANAAGDVVVGLVSAGSTQTVFASTYDAASRHWTSVSELTSALGRVFGLGIDSRQRAVVAWGTSATGYGWSRLDGQRNWSNVDSPGPKPLVGVTAEGRAIAVSHPEDVSLNWNSRELDLSDGSIAPPSVVELRETNGCLAPIASRLRLAFLCTRFAENAQELVAAWNVGSTWRAPEQVASAPDIQSFVADSDDEGNIIVVWRQDDEVRSRVYDHASGEWTPNQFVATTSTIATVLRPTMTGGNAIVAVNSQEASEGTWAKVYRSGEGWLDDSKVRLDDPGSGYAVALSIDSMGNALAVWQSQLNYRRYDAVLGWQAASSLNASVNPDHVYAAGAPDGSVLIVANDVGTTPNGIPMAVLFE
jgi:hypothetical protein